MKVIPHKRTEAGFGFLQMLATVSIIAILGGIAALKMTSVKDSAEEQRLNTHVASLNSSVQLYLSNGGSLEGLTSAQAVLDKMKTMAANGKKLAGFRGNFVDPRLEAVSQTTEEAAQSGVLRVLWDETNKIFRIADSGEVGIKEFKIDPTATPDQLETEERETQFELAATSENEGAWVWDFEGETSADVTTTGTTVDGDGDLDIDPDATNFTKTQLAMPTVSPGPGSYDLDEYGTSGKPVVLSNPNPSDTSDIYVSVNGSYWSVVAEGGTVNVPPGGSLSTFAKVKDALLNQHYSSYVFSGLFEGTTTNLTQPSIVTSAGAFHPKDETTITVTITHGNDPAHGKAQYSIGGGNFVDYNGPFTLDLADHIDGAVVQAKTVATQWPKYYLESPIAARELPTNTYMLQSPEIASSSSKLHPFDSETVTVTLTDPNATEGSFSQLQFAIDGGEWTDYTAPVELDIDDYPNGVTLAAKAIPTIYVGAFLESDEVEETYEAETVELLAPQFVTSQPDFHPIDHATLTVTMTNPNPAGVSEMEYSLDGGTTWEEYTDPVALSLLDHLNGFDIIGRANPIVHPNNVLQSPLAEQSVGVEQATLLPPAIVSSAPVLNPQGYPTATITLTNPNNSGFSKVVYSLDNEQSWSDYGDPFQVAVSDYPEGVTIITKSEPTVIPEHILTSELASLNLPVPPKLDVPVFGRDAGGYVKSQFDAGIALSDDNGFASSGIKYRVNGGEWQDYDDAFVLTTWPATVEAYSQATSYLLNQDSDITTAVYERIYYTPNLAFSSEASGMPNFVHDFTGEAYAEFKDPVGGLDLHYILQNNYFEWGESSGFLGFENGSYLEYTGAAWEGVQAGELFRLGTLDYFNGSVFSGTGATDVTMELTITLSMPETQETFDIDLALENTINQGHNDDDDADYVRIGNLYSDFTTEIDGIQYGLNLAFGYNGNNGFSTVDEFHVHEAATATADLWGYFTSLDF